MELIDIWKEQHKEQRGEYYDEIEEQIKYNVSYIEDIMINSCDGTPYETNIGTVCSLLCEKIRPKVYYLSCFVKYKKIMDRINKELDGVTMEVMMNDMIISFYMYGLCIMIVLVSEKSRVNEYDDNINLAQEYLFVFMNSRNRNIQTISDNILSSKLDLLVDYGHRKNASKYLDIYYEHYNDILDNIDPGRKGEVERIILDLINRTNNLYVGINQMSLNLYGFVSPITNKIIMCGTTKSINNFVSELTSKKYLDIFSIDNCVVKSPSLLLGCIERTEFVISVSKIRKKEIIIIAYNYLDYYSLKYKNTKNGRIVNPYACIFFSNIEFLRDSFDERQKNVAELWLLPMLNHQDLIDVWYDDYNYSSSSSGGHLEWIKC